MAPAKSMDPMDLVKGAILQCAEAAMFGMPFEVWKTHMGSFRDQGTIESFKNIYKKGGVSAFWKGWQPKMIESALKGAILLFAKEGIIRTSKNLGASDVIAGLVGGFGGGIAQVTVMGPCTFLVTAAVTSDKSSSITKKAYDTFKSQGIKGFYHGGIPLMLRQGTNWASRQGFSELIRNQLRSRYPDPKKAKLSLLEEAVSGVIAGTLSTWNQPFEVLRIQAQFAAARGEPQRGMIATASSIIRESGFKGLFQGIVPRIGLGVAQTIFLVTIPNLLKPYGF